jgi:hypothetical protein
MDPVSWSAVAKAVLAQLVSVAGPLGGNWLKRKWLNRKFRKVVERVSREFAKAHPECTSALAAYPEGIAQELAVFMSSGTLPSARSLGDEWSSHGSLGEPAARQLADEYLNTLKQELLRTGGFRELFTFGAPLDTAEGIRRVEEMMKDDEELRIALGYYAAADEYVRAARALMQSDSVTGWRHEDMAQSFVAGAELCRDWQVYERFREARSWFADLVRGPFEEVKATCENGEDASAQFAVLEQGRAAFKQAVRVQRVP